jgi:glyoxylase-like metal-dependent hydrolase (beta-lactamase superfamily II)
MKKHLPRSKTTKLRLAAATIPLALLTACGGSGDSDNPTAAPPPAATVTPPPAAVPVVPTPTEPTFANEVARHVDAANKIAGTDALLVDTYKTYYCMFAEDRLDLRTAARNDTGRVPLTQIYDDAWYLGSRYVGQYILRSGKGFMLVDSLNNAAEAQQYTVPALNSLGLSATLLLTTVYLTHGHGDHDGGATYLKNNYAPQMLLGSADAAGKTYAPTLIDSNNLAPKTLNVSGREVTLLPTPGHSPGSTSAIIPVHDAGRQINVVAVGGSSMPSDIAGARAYLDSVERTYVLAKQLGVEGSIHPHPVFDGTLKNLDKLATSPLTQPSPFTVGEDRALRGLAIYRQCAAAWVAKVDATAIIPVWRATKLDITLPAAGTGTVTAKLSSAWGPVANQQISLMANDTGSTCVATTDKDGVGSCEIRTSPIDSQLRTITGSFVGAKAATYVDLPTKATLAVR